MNSLCNQAKFKQAPAVSIEIKIEKISSCLNHEYRNNLPRSMTRINNDKIVPKAYKTIFNHIHNINKCLVLCLFNINKCF